MEKISSIFKRLEDIRYYVANDRTYLNDLLDNPAVIDELEAVVSKLEDICFSKIADGTTRSHAIEED